MSVSCRAKARFPVHLYRLFCNDDTPANRMAVLNAAKELDEPMTTSGKKAEARIGGFVSGASSSARRAVTESVTLNDINNGLRLLVDAVRRLAEAGFLTVSVHFTL
jgi:hypothetical protein